MRFCLSESADLLSNRNACLSGLFFNWLIKICWCLIGRVRAHKSDSVRVEVLPICPGKTVNSTTCLLFCFCRWNSAGVSFISLLETSVRFSWFCHQPLNFKLHGSFNIRFVSTVVGQFYTNVSFWVQEGNIRPTYPASYRSGTVSLESFYHWRDSRYFLFKLSTH